MALSLLFPQRVYADGSLKYGIAPSNSISDLSLSALEESLGKYDIYVIEIDSENNIPYYDIFACLIKNKTPLISIGENCNMVKTAKALGRLNRPFTAEICPLTSSCTLSKEEYLSLFQSSSAAFKKYAPKCTVLYSFSLENTEKAQEYFPGSYYADEVGFILCCTQQKNLLYPYLQTKKAYDAFSSKLPVMFSRFAVSHFSTASESYTTEETIQTIENFYDCVKTEFSKISAVIYWDKYVSEKLPQGAYANDYRISQPKELAEKYKAVVKD